MAHKFTIEYDLMVGLHGGWDGRDHCLGVYDTVEQAQAAFTSATDKVHDYYMELPFERRQRASWMVAVYARRIDEDGELTDEDAWNDLTEEEKSIINSLNVGKI